MTGPAQRSFAIVPAAGRSSRMGQPKLLLAWGQRTVIERTLANWRASGVTEIIVVACPGDEALARLVRTAGVGLVIPDFPPPDMKASVQCGLRFVEEAWKPGVRDVWLLAPADMPALPARVVDRLLRIHQESEPQILVPTFHGRGGHPVLFPWPMAERLSSLGPSEGLNELVRRGPARMIETDDDRILADLDTPEDYERLKSREKLA